MAKFTWIVQFDNVTHVVREETPSILGAKCRIFFDQELVEERTAWDLTKLKFAFERGGHTFQTRYAGGWTPTHKLYVDGVEVKHDTLTVIPSRSADSGADTPSSADTTVAKPDNAEPSVARPVSGTELVSEDNIREDTEVIATEEYPLDNRAGAESVSIEHEISRTVSNEMSVGNATQKDSGISIELLNLIKGDLSAKLVKQTGQTLGESVTRRHSIRFSAGPHQAVTYVVVWKRRVRTGNYLVLNNGTYTTVPYTAYFDLTFEVQSR